MRQGISGLIFGLARSRFAWFLGTICLFLLFFTLTDRVRIPTNLPDTASFVSRAVTQQQGLVTVRAAVLTDEESQRYLGIALADEGIQAIWLSVENAGMGTLYYLPITTDPSYFTPSEAAHLFHRWWPAQANSSLDDFFLRNAMPDIVQPQHTVSELILNSSRGRAEVSQCQLC